MSINQFPIGAPTDPFFTDADLLDIAREFVLQPGAAYFSTDSKQVVCVPDSQDPWRQQVCSTKAVEQVWTAEVWVPAPLEHHEVPEPGPVGWCLFVLFVLYLWRRDAR